MQCSTPPYSVDVKRRGGGGTISGVGGPCSGNEPCLSAVYTAAAIGRHADSTKLHRVVTTRYLDFRIFNRTICMFLRKNYESAKFSFALKFFIGIFTKIFVKQP